MTEVDSNSQFQTQVNGRSVRKMFGCQLKVAVATICLIPLLLFLTSLTASFSFLGEMLNNFRLQITILMLVGNGLWMMTGKFWLSLGYFMLVIGAGWNVFSIYLPASQPATGQQRITVMTFNLFNKNANPIDDVQTIFDLNADILLLTEYTNQWSDQLQPLKLRYPYSLEHPRWHGYGIAIFSKFPLSNQRVVNLTETTDVPMLSATAVLDQQELNIIGVHTVSPVTGGRLEIRNKQIELIASKISDSRQPIVLLGDLNCVPWSTFMSPLTQTGLRDSRQGFGFHASWNRSFGPFKIPIDHCYVSETIHVHDRVVGPSYGSDHFPVMATISISDQ